MQEKTQKNRKRKIEDNIIYIGDKPFANYILSLFTQISKKDQKETKVIARGKFISRAVDVVEMAKRRFSEGENKIKDIQIKIGSESLKKREKDGRERDIHVSSIEITLFKG